MPIGPLPLSVLILIVGRVAGIFTVAPVFSSREIPGSIRMALIVWISLLLWYVVPVNPSLPQTPSGFVFVLCTQVLIGLLMGFVCNLIFLGVQSAGEIVDLQMGLSVASAFDPAFGAVTSIVGRLAFYLALAIFLVVNGHHMILSAFYQSFQILPVGSAPNIFSPALASQMIDLGKMLWITAFKLAGPGILLIFLLDFSFGLVSRVAPQVNVFMLGFQIKPSLGLIAILITLPFWVRTISDMIATMGVESLNLLQALSHWS